MVSSRRLKTLPWISFTVVQSGSFLPTTTPVSFPGPRPESFLSWQRTRWMSLLGQWGLMNNLVDVVEGRVGNFISDNSWLKSSGQNSLTNLLFKTTNFFFPSHAQIVAACRFPAQNESLPARAFFLFIIHSVPHWTFALPQCCNWTRPLPTMLWFLKN